MSGEPADPLLQAIADHWPDILQYADEEQAARLLALIAEADESNAVEARAALGDELFDLLPGDHPVIRAMRATPMYSAANPDPGLRTADALRWLRAELEGDRATPTQPTDAVPTDAVPTDAVAANAGPADTQPTDAGPTDALAADTGPADAVAADTGPTDAVAADGGVGLDEFDRRVRARLLGLPWLTVEAVRGNRVDPGSSALIRLTGPEREVRLPAFQFGPDGRPWPVVQEVNERLGAAADPWGVTCWWVDPHQRLAACPQDLLGQGSDEVLRRAAAAVGEDWLCLTTCRRPVSSPGRGSSGCRPGRSCGGSPGSRGRCGGGRSPFLTLPDSADYDQHKSGRFDPTSDCMYTYCYAALDDLTALCEVLLRDVGFSAPSRYIPRAEVAGRRLSLLETQKALWLVSLSDAADLAAARQDSWLIHAEAPDYRVTQRWAHWLRDSTAPDGQAPAGLMWRAKRQPGGQAVMLFGDRCEGKVCCSSLGERRLDDEAGLKWLNLRLELLRTRVAG